MEFASEFSQNLKRHSVTNPTFQNKELSTFKWNTSSVQNLGVCELHRSGRLEASLDREPSVTRDQDFLTDAD